MYQQIKSAFKYSALGYLAALSLSAHVEAQNCPSSHPLACGGACYVDAAQAASGGCSVGNNNFNNNSGGNNSNNNFNNNAGNNNAGNNNVSTNHCPSSHPYSCGSACYVDAAQAASGGCFGGGNSNGGGNNNNPPPPPPNNGGGTPPPPPPSNGGGSNPGSCGSDTNPTGLMSAVSGQRNSDTQDWCDTTCITYLANDTACVNKDNFIVTTGLVCSDPQNAIEAIKDVEYNLCIDIDDSFVAAAGYQAFSTSDIPPLNPVITKADAEVYFNALMGSPRGTNFVNVLDANNDGILTRSEASQVKGSDPTQTLNTGFGCGLSTDDVMAYVGLYMGDAAIDKYAGDLDQSVKDNMLKFTRSWQPGVTAQDCEYRGGCTGNNTSASNVSMCGRRISERDLAR
ncbi:hypothetical protein [Marinibactrum halimedae]|uniref:EF-hand domain-containing protein n=1 Tax=Marinibactrum halimedae TaxID=1444977 RepID=A0AA37T2X7_9GAMM|nr:hypothetical protein [Marinibactrum halimedae]MCD9461090.1 hypothetical protein [Marinibactrum halimedae]GLS25740.1 hypothetical protein GCM10007877_14540 [Marinibactrum halimedae]